MSTIKKNYLIEKRNALNEMRTNEMTHQESRFFVIYLSKINPRDTSTRLVRFTLDDFQAIMELDSQIKIRYMKQVAQRLLSKIVIVPEEDERGKIIGFNAFQLFKRCKVIIDNNAGKYIEIDAHDDSLQLMFEFKEKYFTYELWNALSLKGPNQLRMYEILKQYEKVGYRILFVDTLKELLWIKKGEYNVYTDFKKRVLNSCQKALAKHTDIKFTYEPYGKRGKAGKILQIKFSVQKNTPQVNQISLDDFIKQNKQAKDDLDIVAEYDSDISVYESRILFLSDACDNEFSIPEIKVLHDKMVELFSHDILKNEIKCYDYLQRKYRYMNMQNEKNKIKYRLKYMLSIIGKE
jgi:plasmid replication initiation protein